jgi:hypothetical protein
MNKFHALEPNLRRRIEAAAVVRKGHAPGAAGPWSPPAMLQCEAGAQATKLGLPSFRQSPELPKEIARDGLPHLLSRPIVEQCSCSHI